VRRRSAQPINRSSGAIEGAERREPERAAGEALIGVVIGEASIGVAFGDRSLPGEIGEVQWLC
jgi:hypothetical protein